MIYLCIYNPETREILGQEEYSDAREASDRYNMYVVECMARGSPWTPSRGDKPYEFPEEVANA